MSPAQGGLSASISPMPAKKLMEKTILPVVAAENHAFETMSSEEQKALLGSTGDYIALLRENIEKTLFPLLKD